MRLNSRTVCLVASMVAIAASFLVGAGVLPMPISIGIALAFYALFIVPGVAVGYLVFGRSAPLLETVCGSFSGGVVFASAVVCLGFIPGVSYGIISLAAALFAALMVSAGAARGVPRPDCVVAETGGCPGVGAPRRRGRSGVLVAVLLFVVCFMFFYGSGELGWSTDAPDHVSYLRRSLETGSLFPSDSFYRDGDGASFDMRKGLWHPVLALWAYRAHAAPDVLWRALPAYLAYFALAAFLFFGIELLGSWAYATLGLVFMLLFYGGEGVEWLTKIGFGRNTMQVLFWTNAAFLLRYYRVGAARYLVASFLVSAVGCAFHIVYALLVGVLLLGVLCYTLLTADGVWRRRFWWSALVAAMGLAAPLLVRARGSGAPLNEIHAHRQGMLVLSRHLAVVDPVEILMRAGLIFFFALLAMPIFFLVAPRARRALVFTLTLVPMLVVLNPALAPLLERCMGYLHYRMLEAAPLMFFSALVAGGLARLVIRGAPIGGVALLWRRFGALAGLVFFLYVPLRAAAPQFAASVGSIIHREGVCPAIYRSFFDALEGAVPRNAVIVSDPMTSYLASAYTDHFVVVTLDQHGSPTDSAALERLRAVRDVMSPAVPLVESVPSLRRWGADYILLNTNLPVDADFFGTIRRDWLPLAAEKLRSCPRLLKTAFERDGFILYSVRRDSTVARCDSCDARLSGPLSCSETRPRGASIDVGCGVMLEGMSMDASVLAPGDTLCGHFCWRPSEVIVFGLPVELTIRIDADFPKGDWYRAWYGKQYRRIVERRRGVLYRQTWSGRLASGVAMPDQWELGETVRQPFSIVIPPWMAPGRYVFRVKVWRRPYLQNRSLSDYLSNGDSLEGTAIAEISIGARGAREDARQAPSAVARREW